MSVLGYIILILKIIAAILLVVCLLIFIFISIPFKYTLNLHFIDNVFNFDFAYSFVKAKGYIAFKIPIKFHVELLGRIIADSEVKKEKKEKNKKKKESIADTDFIKNKSLAKEVDVGSDTIKDLFKRAKAREKELKSEIKAREKKEKEVFSFIDRFKCILPIDLIDVAKLIAKEIIPLIRYVRPKTIKTDFNIGFDDPYTTGVMMAVLGPIYAMTDHDYKLKFDTHKGVFNGHIYMSANPRVIFIAIPIIKLFLNDKFRKVFFKSKRAKL